MKSPTIFANGVAIMTDHFQGPAKALSDARREAIGLPAYPGALPVGLEDAYAVQAEASRLWSGPVAGWKIGRIMGEAEQQYGKNRFMGPIFTSSISEVGVGDLAQFPIIRGGAAALEAEVVAILADRMEPGRADWSSQEVVPLLSGLRIGIEVAGCPVFGINDLGPLASIAAFGNNLGLILGPSVTGWPEVEIDGIACRAVIDGTEVGNGIAGNLPGGPLAAIAFALNQAAELGIVLGEGSLLSTGAITGVHPVEIGQYCETDFGPFGLLRCETVAALPA